MCLCIRAEKDPGLFPFQFKMPDPQREVVDFVDGYYWITSAGDGMSDIGHTTSLYSETCVLPRLLVIWTQE